MAGTQSVNGATTPQINGLTSDTTTDSLSIRSLAKAENLCISAHLVASSSPTGLTDEHICYCLCQ